MISGSGSLADKGSDRFGMRTGFGFEKGQKGTDRFRTVVVGSDIRMF